LPSTPPVAQLVRLEYPCQETPCRTSLTSAGFLGGARPVRRCDWVLGEVFWGRRICEPSRSCHADNLPRSYRLGTPRMRERAVAAFRRTTSATGDVQRVGDGLPSPGLPGKVHRQLRFSRKTVPQAPASRVGGRERLKGRVAGRRLLGRPHVVRGIAVGNVSQSVHATWQSRAGRSP
jgi:hypothetical protein